MFRCSGLDENSFGRKCHWTKPFLDEGVIGSNRFWMKVFFWMSFFFAFG